MAVIWLRLLIYAMLSSWRRQVPLWQAARKSLTCCVRLKRSLEHCNVQCLLDLSIGFVSLCKSQTAEANTRNSLGNSLCVLDHCLGCLCVWSCCRVAIVAVGLCQCVFCVHSCTQPQHYRHNDVRLRSILLNQLAQHHVVDYIIPFNWYTGLPTGVFSDRLNRAMSPEPGTNCGVRLMIWHCACCATRSHWTMVTRMMALRKP